MFTQNWVFGLLAIILLPSAHACQPDPTAEKEPPLEDFVRSAVADFHHRRLQKIASLELENVLERKNPYLLRAKSPQNSRELVTQLLDSHLAPQEAGIFGSVMEQVALEVCRRKYGGRKSAVEGIDLEFERDGARYIVSIKSGPNWGNSAQIAKMRDYFRKAKKVLGTNAATSTKVVAVNGCCYGRTPTEDRGDYLKLCGESFWTLISGEKDFYLRLITLIGDESAEVNQTFQAEYEKAVVKFSAEFTENYCNPDGEIQWEKIVRLNSGNR